MSTLQKQSFYSIHVYINIDVKTLNYIDSLLRKVKHLFIWRQYYYFFLEYRRVKNDGVHSNADSSQFVLKMSKQFRPSQVKLLSAQSIYPISPLKVVIVTTDIGVYVVTL